MAARVGFSKRLLNVDDHRVMTYIDEESTGYDAFRLTVTTYPERRVTVEHIFGGEGDRRNKWLGSFPSISAARKAIKAEIGEV